MTEGSQRLHEDRNHCVKCGDGAIYYRAYSGEKVCEKCFKDSIVEKVKKTISKYRMLSYGDKIAMALSGGKDSVSLLHILRRISRRQGSELHAVTVDEGIVGYRDEAVRFAQETTAKLGVPLTVLSFEEVYGFTLDQALKARKGNEFTSCTLCGTLRRRAIEVGAKKVGASVIATAHNLDDMVQTFFMNVIAGDIERIRALNPCQPSNEVFGPRRIKPFMEVYEEELALYAYLNDLPLQSVACPYMDEGIRSEMRNILYSIEARHPGAKYGCLSMAIKISQGLLPPEERKVRVCESCGGPSSARVCSVCEGVLTVRSLITKS